MSFKCGIIGLPNVGKSTIFNALTNANVEAKNFPFCTIKPNIGIVSVPDIRLYQLAKIVQTKKITQTKIQFIDIAGLIKNSSKGEGLGNKFLNTIRETDAIIHVVRCFDNHKIIHINDIIDPINDINIINTELILADLEKCENIINRIQKQTKLLNTNTKNKILIFKKCLSYLENGNLLRISSLSQEELHIINDIKFLTIKPTMYVANIDTNNNDTNEYLTKINKIAKQENTLVVPIPAINKSCINKFELKTKNIFEFDSNIQNSSLNKIIYNGYNLLNLKTFFTIGNKEIRAWTFKTGMTAQQAAGIIHSDFEKGFIRAKTISFNDFINCNGEQKAQQTGKVRIEGKKYLVQDGDIFNFLYNI